MFKFENFSKYKNQILATLAVCSTAFLHGVGLGWLSPAIIYLQSNETTLASGPITNDQITLLSSIFPLGSTIGSFLFGYIGNAYGRKKALMYLVVSQLIFWSTIIFAEHIETLYFVRVMSGVNSGSSFVTIPVYITEISSKEIRGSLGSALTFAISIGMTVGYIIGAYLPYEVMPRIFVGFPILYFICIYKLPETPQFLFLKGKQDEARNSLKFYRNAKQLNASVFDDMFIELKENYQNSQSDSKITLSDYINKPTLITFGHCIILGTIYFFSGGFVIISLAGSVFKETGANLDPNTSAIFMGFCYIGGNYISILIANRLTRKNLIALSSGFSLLGYTTTIIFVMLFNEYENLRNDYSWIPILTLSLTILSASFGIMSLAFHVIAELVPPKIFWSTIILAEHIETLYFVRVMSGVNAGSSFVTIPVYVTEISSKEIRGSLGSAFTLAIATGITVAFIIGAYLPYEIMPRIFVGFPIIYFICIYKLPETPQLLFLKGKQDEARNSLKFYRNAKQLKDSVFEDIFTEFKENYQNSHSDSKITLSDYINKPTLIIFGHCIILGTIYLFTGGFVIISLAGSVFKETGANLDPNTSAILMGFSHIAGNYISILIANRLTRKNLIALSSGFSLLGYLITIIFIMLFNEYENLRNDYSWIPILTLSLTILSASFGIMSLVFHVIAELVPPKIKSHAFAFVNISINFVSITTFQIYSNLMFYFGLVSALAFCSISCIISMIYVLLFLPETSQKFV